MKIRNTPLTVDPPTAPGEDAKRDTIATKQKSKAHETGSPKVKSASRKPRLRRAGRRRGRKQYPVMTFDEALRIAQGIMKHGDRHPIRRMTLLSKIGLTDTNSTRNLITTASRYGLIDGSCRSEELKLTPSGRLAVDPAASPTQKIQALFELAIKETSLFNEMYERFKDGRLPAPEVLRDSLKEIDLGDRPQCVDIFISNAQAVGLLATIEGGQHLLSIEALQKQLPLTQPGRPSIETLGAPNLNGAETDGESEDFDKVCFFIAPIGNEGTEQRSHSDAILASFIEPALAEHKLKLIRADKITKPGMISGQVIQYILKSKLVVADLSFHNPNVFYELCLRHVTGLPTVHLTREADHIPFDIGNFRTIKLKMDSIYGLLAKLDTYRAEIAQQIRQVLMDGTSTDNPILTFCPKGRFIVDAVSTP